MKYLNKRDEFIKNKIQFKKINEDTSSGAGPFSNDVGWHDSLLGRLIDHTIRKAKIRYKANRMDRLIKQLNDEFERINAEGAATQLGEEEWRNLTKLKLYSIFYNLTEAVEKGYKVRIIKNLTDEAIKAIEDERVFKDREEYKALKTELEEFRKFLEQFDDNEGADDPTLADEKDEDEYKEGEGSEEGKEGEGSEEGKEGELSSGQVYALMIKNLTSLSHILSNYEKVNLTNQNHSASKSTGKEEGKHKYVTREGDTFQKIQANPEANIKKLDIAAIRQKNPKVSNQYTKDNQTMKPGLVLVMESMSLLENKFGVGGSKDRANIKSGEDHLTQAFTKLKKDIEVLKSSKEKGVGIDINFLSEIVKGKNDSTNKEYIRSLYRDIKRYLVGDAKATIQEKDPLYKESIEFISDKRKRMVVAEKIARFTKRAMQFKGTGLEGGLGDLKTPLQNFISSMETILKSDISVKEEPKKEEVKESKLLRYGKFVSYIKEAEESQEDAEARKVSDIKEVSVSSKIKDFYDKNCMTVKSYVMEKTEAEKLGKNLEAKEKEGKKGNFVISGFDPIIEICRLFNRAFKLYIVRYQREITKRSDAKYSSAFIEYTPLGGSDGPWRNNKLFDQWENAVFNILGDKKYQHIFSPSTKLRIPNTPNPKTPDDYDLRDKAGANLRKMITDMLDGDDLYKIGGSKGDKGKQNEFLEKYFGAPDEETKDKVNKSGLSEKGDGEENADSSKKIEESKIKLKFSKSDDISSDEGTFFAISGTKKTKKDEEAKVVYRYFFILNSKSDPDWIYLAYSESFREFKRILDRTPNKKEIESGDMGKLLNSPGKVIFYTRVNSSEFNNLMTGKVNIQSIGTDYNESKSEKIEIKSTYKMTQVLGDGKIKTLNILSDDESSKNINELLANLDEVPSNKISSHISSAPDSQNIKISKSE